MCCLLVLVAIATLFAGTDAMLGMAMGMSGHFMIQCLEVENCNITGEYFRRMMRMDETLLSEELNPESTEAWNWVSCIYEQGGMANKEGNIATHAIDMSVPMIWTEDGEKKEQATQVKDIIKACAGEVKDAGTNRAEKTLMFYKCLFKKELPLPRIMNRMKKEIDAGQKCSLENKVTAVDAGNLAILSTPMNPVQGGFVACMIVELIAEGDEVCSCYMPKLIERIQDDGRRGHYEVTYKECKSSFPDVQEKYHKVNDFEKFRDYIIHMYDCLAKNIDGMSPDDFYSL